MGLETVASGLLFFCGLTFFTAGLLYFIQSQENIIYMLIGLLAIAVGFLLFYKNFQIQLLKNTSLKEKIQEKIIDSNTVENSILESVKDTETINTETVNTETVKDTEKDFSSLAENGPLLKKSCCGK